MVHDNNPRSAAVGNVLQNKHSHQFAEDKDLERNRFQTVRACCSALPRLTIPQWWCRADPNCRQGLNVLGTPLGQYQFGETA